MAKKPKINWLDRRVAKPGSYLALCLNADELAEAYRGICKEYLAFPETGATAFSFRHERTNETCSVVALSVAAQTELNSIEIAGMLVHEAVHVWQYYAEKMGETNPGDEQEAYAIQAISQELLAEYARRIMNGTAPQPKEFILG